MTYLVAVIFFLYAAGVVSLGWSLWRTWLLVGRQRATPPAPLDEARSLPTLDVMIPVKDEAHNIRACIESVLAQDYRNLRRIVIVNDRSTDHTAEVVAELQREQPIVHRIDIRELPDGLYGKPHALHQAAGELSAGIVAFVDSDLLLDRRCLRTLVQALLDRKLDWVATMGAPEVTKFWERLLVPQLGAVTFAWYDPRKISDPAWPNAIGSALMVARRDSYEAIGGHGAVIRIYDEDSELIRIAKRAGQRVSFLLTPELFKQRHYGTLANTIRGVTRTFIGGIKTLPRLAMTIHALNFVCLMPFEVFAVVALCMLAGLNVPLAGAWVFFCGLHAVVSLALAHVIYETAKTPRGYALLHPLGAVILIWVCLVAMVRVRRGAAITWRGTTTRPLAEAK